MNIYVLDTNLFFNMEAGLNLGLKTEEVVLNLTQIIKNAKKLKEAEFIVSPRIVDELLSFFEDKEQDFLTIFLSELVIKAPHISNLSVNADVFYKLVEDIRVRSYRGLSIAEEEIKTSAKLSPTLPETSKKEFEIKIGPIIKKFRERYRQATRFGFLDSLADLDLIMLSKEANGYLISSDEGVIKWGREFGVREMPVVVFGKKMRSYLDQS